MEYNYCLRTKRNCINGAFDGGDDLEIDCPMSDPNGCQYLAKDPIKDLSITNQILKGLEENIIREYNNTNGNKILAIKWLRSVTFLGLKDAKDFIEKILCYRKAKVVVYTNILRSNDIKEVLLKYDPLLDVKIED
jgi:hypothetical protein